MPADTMRFAFLLLGAGALCFWTGGRRLRTVRRVQDTARSRAASAPQGQVELQGAAWPEGDHVFRSSTGAEVVYHSLKIQREEWRGSGKSRRREWITVFRKATTAQFFLADATGLVRVDPVGAELDLAFTRKRSWRSLSGSERERVLEAMAGSSITGFPPSEFLFGLFDSRYRVVEAEVRVGSPLYARGDFRTAEGTLERVRTRGLTLFHGRFFDAARREAKDFGRLLDADGDGKVSAAEAIEGLCRAAASDREAARAPGAAETEFPVHGRLATSPQHKLFVADRHEEHLLAEMTRSVYLPLAGGAVAVTAGLVLMSGWIGEATTSRPAKSVVPAPGVHTGLRSSCLGGTAAACDELLRRADDLRVTEAYRRDYAQQACRLGLQKYCAAAPRP